ncbi:MAG: class I SAM-dependent methyltransferase [Deltaproteobacteria bacterium]|nr:class I SAM-dependent methyltransferase [Deltaproteobacteria bacterium]
MADARRLTDDQHWTEVHRTNGSDASRTITAYARRLLGPSASEFFSNGGYAGYVVAERVLGPYLDVGARVLEIGSAPGVRLARLAKRFQCDPWGLEYTSEGARLNRDTFARYGFSPDHVIEGDFFSDAVVDAHRDAFDVVVSNGFIEHFTDVAAVVERHIALVRPGGILAISIPNLRGVNYWLSKFFNADVLAKHNLSIMTLPAFSALFEREDLESLYCGYVGWFFMGLQNTPPGSPKRHLLRAGMAIEKPFDLAAKRLFGSESPQLPALSPFLYYVGRRRE